MMNEIREEKLFTLTLIKLGDKQKIIERDLFLFYIQTFPLQVKNTLDIIEMHYKRENESIAMIPLRGTFPSELRSLKEDPQIRTTRLLLIVLLSIMIVSTVVFSQRK